MSEHVLLNSSKVNFKCVFRSLSKVWAKPFFLYRVPSHGVRWGIKPLPPSKTLHPLFLAKPPLNLQTVQALHIGLS